MLDAKYTRMGIRVLIRKDNKILLAKRKSQLGYGKYTLPGGNIEPYENSTEAAIREIKEETGLDIKVTKEWGYNFTITDEIPYVTFYVLGEVIGGELSNPEPDKHEDWSWYDWNNLPTPLFFNIDKLIKKYGNPYVFSAPKIGVAIFIRNPYDKNKILMARRLKEHGYGKHSVPGGKLDYGETPEQCAVREVKEETGLDVEVVRKLDYNNDIFCKTGQHYVTLYFEAKVVGGELSNPEPEKSEDWSWWDLYNLPYPQFTSMDNIIKQMQEG